MKFVQINNRILDYDKHKDEIKVIRKIFKLDLKEYFEKFGFQQSDLDIISFDKLHLALFNKNLNYEICIVARKRDKDIYV